MFSNSCGAVTVEELVDEILAMIEVTLKSQVWRLTIRNESGSNLWTECERILRN